MKSNNCQFSGQVRGACFNERESPGKGSFVEMKKIFWGFSNPDFPPATTEKGFTVSRTPNSNTQF
jgi:hypothetical protein